MNNFQFYNPVKIYFGKSQIENLTLEIEKNKKVLLTYGGGSIKSNGVYDQVKAALKDFNLVEFGGIESNPQYETLMTAVELARKEEINFILAVGGGSVIDGSKFIAAAIHHPSDPWNILANKESIKEVLPFGAVLTLPATGSEMNSFSVISKGDEKLGFGGDPRLFAKFAILDPEVTYSLPEKQLGNGIVDAFVHVLEQYLTTDSQASIQDYFAEGILKTLIEESQKVIELKDYNSRANLMWAATQALNGLIGVGVQHDWSTHMIGHELTALHGIDHARSLAVVLPSLLRETKDLKKQKLLRYARNVWNIKASTPDESINQAIIMTEDFFNSVGVPTKLKVYKVNKADIPRIVQSFSNHFNSGIGEHGNITADTVKRILENAL